MCFALAGSMDELILARRAFASDEDFLEQARDYLSFKKTDPAYMRISVAAFSAFKGFPKLIKPSADAGGQRYFELRIYESHSEYKAYMKVKMFNEGELDIFADVGLRGVFFGSAVSGDNLPNLTYMLVYDTEAGKEKAWESFRKAPAWKALKAEDIYTVFGYGFQDHVDVACRHALLDNPVRAGLVIYYSSRSRSRSPRWRHWVSIFFIAIAAAFFCPTRITRRRPRVIAV